MMRATSLTEILNHIEKQFRKIFEPLGWKMSVPPENDPRINRKAERIVFLFSFMTKERPEQQKRIGNQYAISVEELRYGHYDDQRFSDDLVRYKSEEMLRDAARLLLQRDDS